MVKHSLSGGKIKSSIKMTDYVYVHGRYKTNKKIVANVWCARIHRKVLSAVTISDERSVRCSRNSFFFISIIYEDVLFACWYELVHVAFYLGTSQDMLSTSIQSSFTYPRCIFYILYIHRTWSSFCNDTKHLSLHMGEENQTFFCISFVLKCIFPPLLMHSNGGRTPFALHMYSVK